MKLDLISWKWSENIFSLSSLLVLSLSFLLGFVPYGYYFVMAFLSYFFVKENEEKYIFILGYFFASLCQGWLYTYEQILLLSIWVGLVMLFYMVWHNPLHYMNWIGAVLLYVYGMYLRIPMIVNLKYLAFYFLIIYMLKGLFFKRKEILTFMGIIVAFLLYSNYAILFVNEDAMFFLQSLFLLVCIPYLPLSNLMVLLIMGTLLRSGEIGTSLYYVPTIILGIIHQEDTHSFSQQLILYLLMLLLVTQNGIYLISGAIFAFITLYYTNEEMEIESKREVSPYQASSQLLRQFSSICKRMVNVGVESSLIQVMSEVFERSANELGKIEPYEQYPSLIKEVLEGYHYEVKELEVHYETTLYIRLQLYKTSRNDIRNTLIPILETALHATLYLQDYERANLIHSYHECTLVMNPCLQIKYDFKQRAKKEVCGDEINVISKNDKKLFLLSDGMGEGYQAKHQSQFAISFLSELFLLGVPFNQMISLINQFLLLKHKESFATLDILCVNTLTKQCYLYKAGSAQTYLVRNEMVHSFEAQSLPLGIVSRVSPDVYRFEIKEGDTIVLMSDGAESEEMENWLKELKGLKPSALLVELCSRKEREKIVDDMSILVVQAQNNFQMNGNVVHSLW